MSDRLIQISDDFWNIRGSFRVGGVVNIGTQASLVRLTNGKFVFLDAYKPSFSVRREINKLTDDGANVDAIINLHPFHTVHVPKMHELFPAAKLYGSVRHMARAPDLPWEKEGVDAAKFAKRFKDDFEFSVPAGVDFISRNDKVHFSSVLAYHPASKTLHVDDTLMYLRLPLGAISPGIRFHPTLKQALEKRAGAADDFQAWAEKLIENWGDAQTLCAAHDAALETGKPLRPRLKIALRRVDATLAAHKKKYG